MTNLLSALRLSLMKSWKVFLAGEHICQEIWTINGQDSHMKLQKTYSLWFLSTWDDLSVLTQAHFSGLLWVWQPHLWNVICTLKKTDLMNVFPEVAKKPGLIVQPPRMWSNALVLANVECLLPSTGILQRKQAIWMQVGWFSKTNQLPDHVKSSCLLWPKARERGRLSRCPLPHKDFHAVPCNWHLMWKEY